MKRQAPAFEEINMSCEIGAYQGEGEPDTTPPFVSNIQVRAADVEA